MREIKKSFLILFTLCLALNVIAQVETKLISVETVKGQSTTITPPFLSSELVNGQFEFIGLSCFIEGVDAYTRKPNSIAYRYSSNNIWGEWIAFNQQHEQERHHRTAYEASPIFDHFDALQFKIDGGRKSKINFRVYIAAVSDTSPLINNRSLCDVPSYCNRLCWCVNCPIDSTPEFTEPSHIIMHHSAGFNESNDFAAVVKYYWDLHVNTNGWDDIGYNWLIDANGVVYEGRPDGYQGAHFSCINENTVGICMIGDFTSQLPSNLAINALTELIAYEATTHSIDVLDQSYHLTGGLILENVCGHRDGNGSPNGCSTTACPGNTLYPYLNSIKNQVTNLDCYDVLSSDIEVDLLENVISPNPFTVELNINIKSNSNSELFLIDINGKYIKDLKNETINKLSDLESGLYYIISGNRVIEKVIKL